MNKSWEVTRRVWNALYLREMVSRMFENPYAWFWMITEPMLYVAIMVFIRSVKNIFEDIAGVPLVPWLVIGLSAFFMFRDVMNKSINAIKANKALFAYRQIKPIDTVIARAFVEGSVHIIVMLFFIIILTFLGYDMIPKNLLLVLALFFSLWLLGLALGLIFSVVIYFVPFAEKIINVINLPLLILSGAMVPIQYLPYTVQEVLIFNPILHAIEMLRVEYFSTYWSLKDISLLYVYEWLLPFLLLGLLLQARFELKLKQQ